MRDSAGVRIVEFGARLPADSPVELRALAPELVLLNDENDPIFQFVGVRDAVSLPDGGILVAIGGVNEIRVFDDEGKFRRTIGRSGAGPGEFRGLDWIALLPPDSVVAADRALRRLIVTDLTGGGARTISFAAPPAPGSSNMAAPLPVGMFGDGSLLLASYSPPAVRPGSARPPVELVRLDSDGTGMHRLGEWQGDELYMLEAGGRIQVLTPPFPRSTRVAVGQEHFWVVDTDRWELNAYSPDGRLVSSLRRDGAGHAITDERLAAFLRNKYRDLSDGPALEQLLAENRRIAEHASTPAVGELRPGANDVVWISDYPAAEGADVSWYAIGREGAVLQHVRVPANIQVLRSEAEHLIVLVRDELDREHIRRYRLSSATSE